MGVGRRWSTGLGLSVVAGAAGANLPVLEPDQLFEKVSPSVWSVRVFDDKREVVSSGSAVVIGQGLVITNCHVIDKGQDFVVRRENVFYVAELGARDDERDLCQLRIANFYAPAVPVAPAAELRVGVKAYAIGSPRGLENTLSDGIISGVRRSRSGGIEAIQTTAPISPGSSGGGLFDARGRLIGITTFLIKESQNLNFAVPAAWIAEVPARAAAREARRNAPMAVAKAPEPPPTPAPNPSPAQPSPPSPEPPDQTPPKQTDPGALRAEGLRPGDNIQYVFTDLMTGNQRNIAYRVDRIEEGQLVLNQGTRVESLDGRKVKITEASGGEYDQAVPPTGWWKPGSSEGSNWSLEYTTSTSSIRVHYKLTGYNRGETRIRVPAGEFTVTRYLFQGYVRRNNYALEVPGDFKATVWYSEELKRAVRFEVESRSPMNYGYSSFIIRERMELARMPGRPQQ